MRKTHLLIIVVGITILILLAKFWHKKMKYNLLQYNIENIRIYNTLTKASCSIKYPILYINMDRNNDRRILMENQLQKISGNFQRIRGVNGFNIQNTNFDSVDGITFRNYYDDLSKGEIGCTLAHLLAIKTAKNLGQDIVIICEDDLMFDTCTLMSVEKVIENAPKNWDILQLVTIGSYKQKEQLEYIPRINSRFYSNACYAINKNGRDKILSIVESENDTTLSIKPSNLKEKFPQSGTADTYIYDLANTFAVYPNLFITNNLEVDSTIHVDHTAGHIKNSLERIMTFGITSKQINFTKTLLDMADILDKANQTFFLSCGTALGAIREKKFIEHDGDIDLGIFAKDYNPAIENEILKVFKLKHRLGSTDSGYELTFIHPDTNINIDIFIHYPENDYVWTPSFFGVCDISKNKMCRFKYTSFGLKKIDFIGRQFNVPDPIGRYLEESYGVDWKIPKKFSYTEGFNKKYYPNLVYDDFGKEGVIPDIPTVWQYWETKDGQVQPEYIKLCMDIAEKKCKRDGINYVCLTPNNLHDYIPKSDFPNNFYNLDKIAHRADYIRGLVLYYHGGLWIDADTVVTGSLRQILEDLNNNDWIVFADDYKEFSIGIFATRKKSPLVRQWIDSMKDVLEDTHNISWTEIGYDILYPLVDEWQDDYGAIWRIKYYKDSETCQPLSWKEWELFFAQGNSEFLKRDFQPAISLYNAMFPKEFKQMSSSDFNIFLLASNTVLADLLNKNK